MGCSMKPLKNEEPSKKLGITAMNSCQEHINCCKHAGKEPVRCCTRHISKQLHVCVVHACVFSGSVCDTSTCICGVVGILCLQVFTSICARCYRLYQHIEIQERNICVSEYVCFDIT